MLQPVPGHQPTSRLLDLVTSSALVGVLSGAVLHPVKAMSPVDELIANMSTWNLTSEEFFQKKLLILHRRYCFSSRLCFLNLPADSCDYCAPCQCDDDCHHYSDCCPDKLFLNVDEVPPLNLKLGCRDNLYVDYPPSRRETLLVNASSYFMKDSCPPATPATLAANCRNNVDYLPVSVLTNKSGHGNLAVTVFPSKHCAACNGFEEEDMVVWKVLVGCKSGENRTLKDGLMSLVTQAVEDPDCILTYHPPRDLPLVRTCHSPSDMVTSCNVTGAWSGSSDAEFLQRACAAYLDPKVSENRTFQNVFCYLCNFDDPKPFHRCWRSPQMAVMPFSALLDFSDVIFGRVDRSALCQSDQVYDEEKDLCRPVRCSRVASMSEKTVSLSCPAAWDLRTPCTSTSTSTLT
ncbi:uncharacterized protein LOC112571043 [Pomacea canaliculata]|uniref:uncharacterized protein LOC112571043 n=1 Tax=Pomacea canaliculata TaxID=400727 RepID=UPI000D7399E2|nr:uncharacterized protein LOC112571043 [Pomacea canaliculata]XP_025105619.1 uncharacterized protein LOC112571043 [Pomacea canaliculata]